jgi:hypothetical protein
MAVWFRVTLLTAAVAVLQSVVAGNVCYGGALHDWLSGRTPYYRPTSQTVYAYGANPAAATTVPAASVAPTLQPQAPVQGFVGAPQGSGVVVGQPVVAQPTVPATYAPRGCWFSCGSGSCFARQSAPSTPQVRYRTHWVQVPVTVYRPVTGTDPMTGCPTTCLQPCTTSRWQLRRVPVVTYRPQFRCLSWFRNLFRCQRQPAPVCPPTSPPAVMGTTPVVPGLPAPNVTIPPYYSPSPGATLAPAPGATTVPGAGSPSGATSSPAPADTRPTLQPNSASSNPPPATTRAAPTQANSAGATQNRRDHSTPVNAGPPSVVTPIPDPEMPRMTAPRHDPPELLNPRDRTAARGAWEVVPISWSAPSRQPRFTTPAQSTAPRVDFDDSGWRSAS